jgi:hypothetical protein
MGKFDAAELRHSHKAEASPCLGFMVPNG